MSYFFMTLPYLFTYLLPNFKTLKQVSIVVKLLRNKADVNFVNEHGNSPLHYACFWGYTEIAEELVDWGAMVSVFYLKWQQILSLSQIIIAFMK